MSSQRISTGLAVAAAILAFGFAAYLLIVGPEAIFLTPDGPTTKIKSSTPAGPIPLVIGVVAVWAIAKGGTRGYWTAATAAIGAAVLFIFSISLQFAAIAVVLLLAATVRTVAARDIRHR